MRVKPAKKEFENKKLRKKENRKKFTTRESREHERRASKKIAEGEGKKGRSCSLRLLWKATIDDTLTNLAVF